MRRLAPIFLVLCVVPFLGGCTTVELIDGVPVGYPVMYSFAPAPADFGPAKTEFRDKDAPAITQSIEMELEQLPRIHADSFVMIETADSSIECRVFVAPREGFYECHHNAWKFNRGPEIGAFKAGRQSGPQLSAWSNGQCASVTTYVDGILHGEVQQWWPDGRLRLVGAYRNGKPVGRWVEWHPNGQLCSVATFADEKVNLVCWRYVDPGKRIYVNIGRGMFASGYSGPGGYPGSYEDAAGGRIHPGTSCNSWAAMWGQFFAGLGGIVIK